MGQHTRHQASPLSLGRVRTRPPLITTTPAGPDNNALLEILRPLHSERMRGLTELHTRLITNVNLMTVITEWEGWPVLNAYRMTDIRVGSRSRYIRVGCGYWDEEWWYVTPGSADTNVIAAMSMPDEAARIIAGALLS